MKKILLIVLIAMFFVVLNSPHFRAKHPVSAGPLPRNQCQPINADCFKLTMTGQPDLYTNAYVKVPGSKCVSFTSHPDNQMRFYCDEFRIQRVETVQ